jgi:hypothetical protein
MSIVMNLTEEFDEVAREEKRAKYNNYDYDSWPAKVAFAYYLIKNSMSPQLAVTPVCRRAIAMLAAKVAVKDYQDLRLSGSAEEHRFWQQLLLRPVLYAQVCQALGATEVIDHRPERAFDCYIIKNQRRRACAAEIDLLEINTFLLLTAPDEDDKENHDE